MSKQVLLTWAVVSLLLINLALVAFIVLEKPVGMGAPGNGPGSGQIGPKDMIIDRLGFTPDQTVEYEILITRHQLKIARLNNEIRATKNKLYATLATDNQSQKDFFISRLGALQRQVESTHYAHFMDIKRICTTDQQGKFRALTRDLAGYFAMPRKPPGQP